MQLPSLWSSLFNENKNRIQIIELLSHVCHRPGMLGAHGLAGLRALIDGEFYVKGYFNKELSENENKLLASLTIGSLKRTVLSPMIHGTDLSEKNVWE